MKNQLIYAVFLNARRFILFRPHTRYAPMRFTSKNFVDIIFKKFKNTVYVSSRNGCSRHHLLLQVHLVNFNNFLAYFPDKIPETIFFTMSNYFFNYLTAKYYQKLCFYTCLFQPNFKHFLSLQKECPAQNVWKTSVVSCP